MSFSTAFLSHMDCGDLPVEDDRAPHFPSHMDCGDLAPQILPRRGAAVARCFLPTSVPPISGISTHAPDRPYRASARHLRSQLDRNVNPGFWQGGNAQGLGMAQLTSNACRFARRSHVASSAYIMLTYASEQGKRWCDG